MNGRVHLVGIGGAGMSGIARIMLAQGLDVSGSDAKESRRISALRALGAQITIGHDPAVISLRNRPSVVVASTAIAQDNPELIAAREQGIPVWERARALAEVMKGHLGVAVAGTHGKTTTTSMITVALQAAGADPSFAIGSELHESGSNAHLGSGDIFVVEADESDGSFLQLEPDIAVVTNVEADHLDHFSDIDAIDDVFMKFVARAADRSGSALICLDDPGGVRLIESARAAGVNLFTYGVTPEADFHIDRWSAPHGSRRGWTFEVVRTGVRLGAVTLQVPGRHNALNATAALAAGVLLDQPVSLLREGLAAFTGTRRRFELRGAVGATRVFDDYAHHPTEVDVTMRAAREMAGAGRVVVVFQSHRYSRTAAFSEQFGAALADADELIVMEVYPAGEAAIPGASGSVIAEAARRAGAPSVVFEPSWSQVADRVAHRTRPGDLVITMGAGDVGMLAPEIVERLRSMSDDSIPHEAP
jgi:UDP-N-acetylmuramate--alanine ligase